MQRQFVFTQKVWLPHEFTENNKENRLQIAEIVCLREYAPVEGVG